MVVVGFAEADEAVLLGAAEVGAADCALSVALTETDVVGTAAVEVAGPPKPGSVSVSMVLYVVPSITPVRGMVSTPFVAAGLSAENEERLMGSVVGVAFPDETGADEADADAEAEAEAEGEAVEDTASALSDTAAVLVAAAALDDAAEAVSTAAAELDEDAAALVLTGTLICVCDPGAPPNASAGTRIVMVFQSSKPPSLFALTLGRPAMDVGRDLEGTVTVMVSSPVALVASGAGATSEVGRTVVAPAAAALRLGSTAGIETEGSAAGAETEGTAGAEGTAGTPLTGADTEGTAAEGTAAEGTSEGTLVGRAEVGRSDVGKAGVGTTLPAEVGTAGTPGTEGTDGTDGTEGTPGTARLLEGTGAGGAL